MLGRLADAAASLVLGAACPGCGVPCARLCLACADTVADPAPFPVPFAAGLPIVAGAAYDGLWRRVLVAYKERHAWWLADPLGPVLALAVGEALARAGVRTQELVLVPMPSLPRSVRARGLDTTLALTRSAARVLAAHGLDARVEASLHHVRAVADQSGLSESSRHANLAGAMAARAGGAGVRVLVDDLTTTGASLLEACRALAEVGTPASGCAVVAATLRRRRPGGEDPTRPPARSGA
ncbi:MAG: ComF family protein [Actinomycetes bacterium]